MEYRRLGRTNLCVSVIGLGTNQLRRVPERQAIETCKRAFALGVNLVNAEPEYEGAFHIIRRALDESGAAGRVYLSIQTGGSRDQFARALDDACNLFRRPSIDLFGITAISDQQTFGANVWGAGGLVEFLLEAKAQGRIGAIFGSDHGSPGQLRAIIERDVFDALMLAYNPLGHHLVTYRAKTVWHFETPPVPVENYEREDLPRTKSEILPLARQYDVGILLMKPLAGGLLCDGKAFPSRPYRDGLPEKPSPPHVLRFLLDTEPIAAVVPGMASVQEVEDNILAGAPIATMDHTALRQSFLQTSQVLCSRCGDCDDLCSRGLPVSYLFRSAYHYLFPTAPFGISTTLQYFRLHPWEEARCESCVNRTCRCASQIDIPAELIAIHKKMLVLRDAGAVPCADSEVTDFQSGLPFSAKLLSKEIFSDRAVFHFRNTGREIWPEGLPLSVTWNGVPLPEVPLRQPVAPAADGHFAFSLPTSPGPKTLRLAVLSFWDQEIRIDFPAFAARCVDHNLRPEIAAGSRVGVQATMENTGDSTWLHAPDDGHYAGLCLFINGVFNAVGRLPSDIEPGGRATISFTAQMPDDDGPVEVMLDMAICNRFWFRDLGNPPLKLQVDIRHQLRTPTDRLLAISFKRNRSYFSPGMGVYRSHGQPAFPVFAESADGCTLFDVDGRPFTDVLMGWGCSLLGYREPRISEAVQRAISAGGGVLSLPHRLEMEVADLLCDAFPWGQEAIFGKNGSDVTTWAVRVARAATGRKVILGAGYFGWSDWFVGAQGFAATGVPSGNNTFFIPLPFLDIQALEEAVLRHAHDLAAIIIEPAAMCVNPKDPQHWTDQPYFLRARQLADHHGALLIFDEIMTGFRFRSGSASRAFGVLPDLTCLGKALANGLPLSALVGRQGLLMNHSHRIVYAPTMKGETLSFAAAKAALQIYRDEPVAIPLWAAGECIRAGVREACASLQLDAALIGPPYRMYFKFFALEAECDTDVVLHTLLQQELARHGVVSVKGYVILSRAHDADAQTRVINAYAAALQTVKHAYSDACPARFLDVPRMPIERRTAVPSERQL